MKATKFVTFAALLLFIKLGNENTTSTHVETSKDGGLSAQDLEGLIEQAKIMAMNIGLITRTNAHKDKNDVAEFVPFTLFPSPFPRKLFLQAYNIQKEMNLLYFLISLDHKFLEETLQTVAETNENVRGMLGIFKKVNEEGNKQPITLVLERSDYMAHVNKNENEQNFELKQIEVNIGPMGGPARADRIAKIHRHLMQKTRHDLTNMPENDASTIIAMGLYMAWKSFGDPEAIMVVVAGRMYQNFEQHQLSQKIQEMSDYQIKIAHLSLAECGKELTLDENDFILRYNGKAVALVYHKTFVIKPTQEQLNARLKIERSTAIKCPTVALELACTKKVQQALALPGVLERFITNKEVVASIRSTFAGLWGLEKDDEETRQIIEDAIENPDNYVLKPSEEGGGNNFWGEEISQKLRTFDPSERAAHILMQRLYPMPMKNFLVRPFKPVKLEEVVSELSIYGFLLGNAREKSVQSNERRGFMLRTKLENTTEGGIGAGGGLWGLEKDDEETRQIIEDAIENPDNYVLKPSEEGGGNNFWGEEISQKLRTFDPSERAAHILMQRLYPMPMKNFLVRPFKPVKLEEVVSELSIYGFLLGNAREKSVQSNERRGFMLRTKLENTTEGGIGAGGGFHDSIYLF
uniref:Glutathione synthetase n=1 Tax=Globodera rostochiensis TaxID=31243 RepID=A0A914H704_GLORO